MRNIDESDKVRIDLDKLKSRLQQLENGINNLKKLWNIDDEDSNETEENSSKLPIEEEINNKLKTIKEYQKKLNDYTDLYKRIDEFFKNNTTNGKIHKGYEGEYNALQHEFDEKNLDLKKVIDYIEKSRKQL